MCIQKLVVEICLKVLKHQFTAGRQNLIPFQCRKSRLVQVFSLYVFKPIQDLSKLHQIKSVHQRTVRVCSRIRVLYRAGCDKSCVCSLGKKIVLCKDSYKNSLFFFFSQLAVDGQSVAVALLCSGDMNLEFQLCARVCQFCSWTLIKSFVPANLIQCGF